MTGSETPAPLGGLLAGRRRPLAQEPSTEPAAHIMEAEQVSTGTAEAQTTEATDPAPPRTPARRGAAQTSSRGSSAGFTGTSADEIGCLRAAQDRFRGAGKQNATISLPQPLMDTLRRYADGLSDAANLEVPYRAVVIAAVVAFFDERDTPIRSGYRHGKL